MSVKKEITRLEKSNVKLSITVSKEDVESQYQDLVKEYSKEAQIPGFRKGKVPSGILERKFGDALKGETLGKIIEKAIGEVFEDENMPKSEKPLAYSQPQLEGEPKLDFGQDLSFSIVYDVMPDVNIGQWKGHEVDVPDSLVADKDIDRELEEVQERNAFVLDREDGAEARSGDVITINHCELGDDGEELPNGRRDDFAFTLGKGQFGYMMDDDIIGMKKGETKTITKTYPDDFKDMPVLAGKTTKLQVTVTALKEKKTPDLDDDLAQDVDEKFKTLDDLKKSIRERLEKNLEHHLKDIKLNKILEKIMENTPVILPESMVRVELDGRIRNLARRFGTDTEQIMKMLSETGEGLDDIQGKWRPSAERALHSRLIIEKLMTEQNIEAGDDEVEKEIENMAAESGEPVDEIRKKYGEGNALEYIKDNIREKKVFDLLIAENNIKTGPRTDYLDLIANNG